VSSIGRFLMVLGLLLLAAGAALYFFSDLFSFFGRLPGDIVIKKKNFTFCAPFSTMIIVSIVVSLILNLAARWIK